MGLYKNVAGQKVAVFARNKNTGSPATGDLSSSITAVIQKDGGSSTAAEDTNPSYSGIDGLYYFTLSADETNCDLTVLVASCSDTDVVFDPVMSFNAATAPDVNVVSVSGGTGAADNLEAAFNGTGYAFPNSSMSVNGFTTDGRTGLIQGIWDCDLATETTQSEGTAGAVQFTSGVILTDTGLQNLMWSAPFTGDSGNFNLVSGYPGTVGQALTFLFARFGHKIEQDTANNTIKLFAKNGSTLRATQNVIPSIADVITVGGIS